MKTFLGIVGVLACVLTRLAGMFAVIGWMLDGNGALRFVLGVPSMLVLMAIYVYVTSEMTR
jgi:hypothetical protein